MKLQKKWLAAVATGATVAMLLAGCGGASSNATSTDYVQPATGVPSSYKGALPTPDAHKAYNAPTPADQVKDGGKLVLAAGEIGPNWNSLSADGNTMYMGDYWTLYQPQLWKFSFDGKVTPNPDYLTKVTLKSEKPMVLVFDINPKANWNDGSPIDWTAFKSTWEAQNGKNPDYSPANTAGYEQISSVTRGANDKQAVVTFEKPFYPYQAVFMNLVNPKAASAETFNKGWNKNPHNEWAAGPFIVSSLDDNQVTFERNPKWWGQKPKLDKIQYKMMQTSAAVNAFANGEIDAIGAATKDRLKIVRGMKNVSIRLGYSKSTDVLTYNGKAGFLKDIAVRKAITQGFDTETWIKISYQGTDWKAPAPGSEIMLPFQSGYTDNRPAEAQKYDPEGAQKTLEAAGFKKGADGYYAKDGKTLKITYTNFGDSPTGTALANAYQAMMKKIGVKVELKNYDNSKFSKTIAAKDYEVLPMGWNATDPFGYSTSLCQLYCSDSDSNLTSLGSKELDKKLKAPQNISDPAKAIEAQNEAEKAALALYGTIPTDTPPTYSAVKSDLVNFGPNGFAGMDPTTVGWKK